MSPDEQKVRETHATWISAVNAGDLARLLTMTTDDLVLLSPGQEPSGRDGFAAKFSGAKETMRFQCTSELEEVVVAGEVAYTRARDALTCTPRSGGDTMHFAGYRMTVYRQQPDGRWLLARDIHTLAPVVGKD
jgi:uncharacterized protein (TIGR02246 family)